MRGNEAGEQDASVEPGADATPSWAALQGLVSTGPSMTAALEEEHAAEIAADEARASRYVGSWRSMQGMLAGADLDLWKERQNDRGRRACPGGTTVRVSLSSGAVLNGVV